MKKLIITLILALPFICHAQGIPRVFDLGPWKKIGLGSDTLTVIPGDSEKTVAINGKPIQSGLTRSQVVKTTQDSLRFPLRVYHLVVVYRGTDSVGIAPDTAFLHGLTNTWIASYTGTAPNNGSSVTYTIDQMYDFANLQGDPNYNNIANVDPSWNIFGNAGSNFSKSGNLLVCAPGYITFYNLSPSLISGKNYQVTFTNVTANTDVTWRVSDTSGAYSYFAGKTMVFNFKAPQNATEFDIVVPSGFTFQTFKIEVQN